MSALQNQIGSRIKELRQFRGYTQAELAELADVSTAYIGYLERGERVLTLKTLERLAIALNVTTRSFFVASRTAKVAQSPLQKRSPREQWLEKFAAFLALSPLIEKDLKLIFNLTKRIAKIPRHRLPKR